MFQIKQLNLTKCVSRNEQEKICGGIRETPGLSEKEKEELWRDYSEENANIEVYPDGYVGFITSESMYAPTVIQV